MADLSPAEIIVQAIMDFLELLDRLIDEEDKRIALLFFE